MSSPEDKGTVTIPADIEGGEVRVRLAGVYLNEALRACGGMADFKVTDSSSPVIFTVDGYQLVVMPMYSGDSNKPEPETPETGDTRNRRNRDTGDGHRDSRSGSGSRKEYQNG